MKDILMFLYATPLIYEFPKKNFFVYNLNEETEFNHFSVRLFLQGVLFILNIF